MPTIKQMLGALMSRFYSKQQADKSAIADLSGINTKSAVTLTNNSVSPKTGYAIAQMTSDAAGVTAGYLYIDGKPVCGNRVYFQSPDSYILLAPVSKGAQVLVDKVNATVKSITVYGLQGGGKKVVELLQLVGGAVCLNKTLKHFSTESHCRKRSQQSQQKSHNITTGTTWLLRLAMGFSVCSFTMELRSVSIIDQLARSSITTRLLQRLLIVLFQFTSKRGTKSASISAISSRSRATKNWCSSRSKVSSVINQEVSYAC